MTYRLLLAHGHWLMRRGLRATLQGLADHEIVAEAGSVDEAVRQVELTRAELMIVDQRLPGGGAILAMRRAQERRLTAKVMVLGEAGAVEFAREALRAGCDGFVSHDGGDVELLQAVQRVRAGHIHLDAETSRLLVLADIGRGAATEPAPLRQLTERELAVFRLIGAGYTNRAAAERIRLSPRTVEKYRAAVMHKLQLGNAVDLRLLALRLGAAPDSEAGDGPTL